MTAFALFLVALPLLLAGYAYVGYPLVLRLWAARRPPVPVPPDPAEWPMISIVIPAYNEERAIGRTLDTLLALDYPAERRQIIVMSDASTDRTDDIVRGYADRGVELVRMPERRGKSAMENVVLPHVRGEIIVNTDASIRIPPGSLRPLLRVFADPTIGVASGRDISVGDVEREGNAGESGYVDYEMNLRALETRVGTIIGASGCLYAIRREIVDGKFPIELSRDFASPLRAREQGFRSVSVDDATCLVPRTRSLQAEYRRKVRTMARGLATLWFKRHLLNPFRYGRFAFMLVSHKLVRWLVFLVLPLQVLGLALLAPEHPLARLGLAGAALGLVAGLVAFRWPEGRAVPRLVALPGFAAVSCAAGAQAWWRALTGQRAAVWEPTRRP